jgi:SAM-dependent methyltransferase
LTGTPQYLNWLVRVLRPYIGDTVLEVGAGIGHISGRLLARRLLYVAGEKDPLYLHALRNRFLRTPNVQVRKMDPECPADFAEFRDSFDTVLCANVLEYTGDPALTVSNLSSTLKPGGALIVLVPQGPSLYGSIDLAMGHKQRFQRQGVIRLLQEAGMKVESIRSFNRISAPSWWLYSRVLRAGHINKVALKVFDKTVWIWRRIDPALPWPGLSLILIARKNPVN